MSLAGMVLPGSDPCQVLGRRVSSLHVGGTPSPLHNFAGLAQFSFCDNSIAADAHSIVLHDLTH
jgi:hypothetical protein